MKIPGTNIHIGKKPTPKKATPPRRPQNPNLSNQQKSYDYFGSHHVAAMANENGLGSFRETGDAASRYDRETLVALGRQSYDENIIYSTVIDRMTTNLVGANGFGLQARTGDDELNEKIENIIWPQFTNKPEYRDLFSWENTQRGVCKDMLGVGDIGFVKVKNGQLQAVESEWIAMPSNAQLQTLGKGRKVEQGIEMTLGGKLTGFWVNPPSKEGYPGIYGTRVAKDNFIYVHGDIQRFSRTRPLPPFIQMMSCIWRLDDILNSEAAAWQLLAKFAIIINKDGADEESYGDSEEIPGADANDMADRMQDVGPALMFHGAQGDTVTSPSRNLPGKDFPASLRAFMQMFSMRIGLPLEILMLDWSKTNFSSGKAALTQAAVNIHSWQAHEVKQFHKPTYEWIIRRAVAAGELPDIPTIYDHEWFPPMPPWIDAKEEAESWGIRVDRGLVTFSDALKAQGKDLKEENERRDKDIRAAIEMAQKIAEDTGIDVDWKLFAGYLVGKTESAVNAGSTPEPTETEDDATE